MFQLLPQIDCLFTNRTVHTDRCLEEFNLKNSFLKRILKRNDLFLSNKHVWANQTDPVCYQELYSFKWSS